MSNKQYYVYIMTNITNNVLYTGVTNDLIRRIYEHKFHNGSHFTHKYKTTKLVYYEILNSANEAINREKQIKNLVRRKKITLINQLNSNWNDLYQEINM